MKFSLVGAGEYRIGHGNIYINNKTPAKAITIARSTKANSFGFNEAANVAARLAALPAHRNFGALPGFNDMRDAHDCITIVQNAMVMKHHSYTQVSKDVEPLNIARDRGITAVGYRKKGLPPIAHINIHPNPINHLGPKAHPPIVDEYVKNMAALARLQVYLRQLGFKIVTTGDFNLTEVNSFGRSYLNPYMIARQQNMNSLSLGIDGALYDKTLQLTDLIRIPKTLTGSDHPWFVMDLKVKVK